MPKQAGNQRTYFQFALWASALGRVPTVLEVSGYFDISRESAWRTHRNWMRALQLHRESHPSPAAPGTRQHPLKAPQ